MEVGQNRKYPKLHQTNLLAMIELSLEDKIVDSLIDLSLKARYLTLNDSSKAFLPSVDTKIGGLAYSEHGEVWPCCQLQQCDRPLSFIFQVSLPNSHELLSFYYCKHCHSTAEHSGRWSVRTHSHASLQHFSPLPLEEQYEGTISLMAKATSDASDHLHLPSWDTICRDDQSLSNYQDQLPELIYCELLEKNVDLVNGETPQHEHDIVIGGYPVGQVEDCTLCTRNKKLIVRVNSSESCRWDDGRALELYRCQIHSDEYSICFV